MDNTPEPIPEPPTQPTSETPEEQAKSARVGMDKVMEGLAKAYRDNPDLEVPY